MGRSIIYYQGLYQEYSSVCDAPTTAALDLEEFKLYYQNVYGQRGMEELSARLERAVATGASEYGTVSLEQFLCANRAGYKERHLSYQQYIQTYFVERREPREEDTWTPFDWQVES